MTTQTISPNKIVKTRTFSTKRVEVKQDYLTEKLSNYYREFLIGTNPNHFTLAIFRTMEHGKIAEAVISKMYEIPLEAAGNAGYDINTTRATLDGYCYGKVEIRARSYILRTSQLGYDRFYFDFLSTKDLASKLQGEADWFFLCGWNGFKEEPVWFRIPRSRALKNNSLQITTKDGESFGWANEYIWSGPDVVQSPHWHSLPLKVNRLCHN